MRNVLLAPVIAGSLYLAAVTAYLFLITSAAYFFRKKVMVGGTPLKLAVVIPAHNEEAHISQTVGCVLRSRYPRWLYAVFVIVDNCDDRTEELACLAGARVFRRRDAVKRGKGQALDWFIRCHSAVLSAFDAIVMVDADTIVDRRFLQEIGASLKHPEVQAVQGYYGVSNAGEHWRSGLQSAAFHVFNHLRPAGHNRLGGTAGLRGNGMGFRKDLLREGWPAYSIVEDYEFSVKLLLDGVRVHYNPDAMVFSDMPVERKVAETQRMRWEGGSGMSRAFARLVFRKAIRERKACYIDAFADSFVPPFASLVLGQSFFLAAGLFFRSWVVYPLAFCFAADLFYVLSGLFMRGAGADEWKSLLRAPFYIIWKVPLYFRMRNQDATVWKRTRRPSEA